MVPPAGSARAMCSVETPMAVPTSTTRRAPQAAVSTLSSMPVSGTTMGIPSRAPCASISDSTGSGAGRSASR